MARVYFAIARTDLPSIGDSSESALQINDLKPNSVLAGRNINGAYGQTGHFAVLADYSASTAADVGGVWTLPANVYNLTCYLQATLDDHTTGTILTNAHALACADDVADIISAGGNLTVAALNAVWTATCGGATGIGVAASTAVLTDILRIVSGEVYCTPAGAISGAAAAVLGAAPGYFVARPEVLVGSTTRGRNMLNPIGWGDPVQTVPQDTHFVDLRQMYDTGDLHRSIIGGQLSHVTPATWTWTNPSFTYAGGAHPAQTIGGVNIAATGAGRAVSIYDASGNVL